MSKSSTTETAAIDSGVFELIAAFGEAADARLRGNSVHALAALNSVGTPEVAQRAEREIVRILSQEPATGGGEWERRLAARALPALRGLPEDTRSRVGLELQARLADAADANQRAGIARLLLAANEPPERLWPLPWWPYCQLGWLAGSNSFWRRAWSGAWRSALVWYPMLLLLASEELVSLDSIFLKSLVSVLAVCLLAVSSVPGRITPARRVVATDVAICSTVAGATGLLFAVVGLSESDAFNSWDGAVAALIGATVGALLRWMRWFGLRYATEPLGTGFALRPVAALVLTTALVMAAVRLGADSRFMVDVWLLLCPTMFLLAWIDIWLLGVPPIPVEVLAVRGNYAWVLPTICGGLAIVLLLSGYMNHSAASERAKARAAADKSAKPTELPPAAAPSEEQSVRRIPFASMQVSQVVDVTVAGSYLFRTSQPVVWQDPTLTLLDANGKVIKEDRGAPLRVQSRLDPGRYRLEYAASRRRGGKPSLVELMTPVISPLDHQGAAELGGARAEIIMERK